MTGLHDVRLDLILRGLRSEGIRNAIYMACPITSGFRELALMADLGVNDRADLRRQYRHRWRAEVFDPNVADARATAKTIRTLSRQTVIDPTQFETPGLLQEDYDDLCEAVIGAHAGVVALAPGWQFSRGARLELRLALSQQKSVTDMHGKEMTPAFLQENVADADATARGMMGLEVDIDELLPTLRFEDETSLSSK